MRRPKAPPTCYCFIVIVCKSCLMLHKNTLLTNLYLMIQRLFLALFTPTPQQSMSVTLHLAKMT